MVLVVGHSNTVPAILAALGGERLRDLCDYSSLFTFSQRGATISLIRSRFGVADKSETTPGVCAVMR